MPACDICGQVTTTSQGLAGHKWLKHGKKKQEQLPALTAAAQQPQRAQAAQSLGSLVMVQVPASYFVELQQQAQLAQLQQGQRVGTADVVRSPEDSSVRTVGVDPLVWVYFDYIREKGYTGDLSALITEAIQYLFHSKGISLRIFTPV